MVIDMFHAAQRCEIDGRVPEVEARFRLGPLKCLDQASLDGLMGILCSSHALQETPYLEVKDVYSSTKGTGDLWIRTRMLPDTSRVMLDAPGAPSIVKKRMKTVLLAGRLCCAKIQLCEEIPYHFADVSTAQIPKKVRIKKRKQFKHTSSSSGAQWCYEASMVFENSSNLQAERLLKEGQVSSYELELEFCSAACGHEPAYLADSLLRKVQQVLSLIDEHYEEWAARIAKDAEPEGI